jgi:hypothetical protein
MKEIDFIGSENVVIMESPEKNSIIEGAVNYIKSFILSNTNDKISRFNSKKFRL